MKGLLIVAAGKSSRFGGFPKAFCNIGGITNVENTIQHAQKVYDKIYLALNERTYHAYKGTVDNCEMFSIIMGHGDAHSLLRCLEHIRDTGYAPENISVCWGDAYFINEKPFIQITKYENRLFFNIPVLVGVALDKNPYAWFETEGMEIMRAHFAKIEGAISEGLHDQSLFLLNVNKTIEYLTEYRIKLKIPMDISGEDNIKNDEMKLLSSFEFLYNSESYTSAFAVPIDAGNVLAFNTIEELKWIEQAFLDRGGNTNA